MNRELVYRIVLKTDDARREAANIRATFERELRQIRTGNIDFSSASGQAKQLTTELNNVAESGKRVTESLPNATDAFGSGIEGAINQIKGLATAYIGLQAVTSAIDLSRLGTQANRTFASLNILSGSGEKTAAVLEAIKKASNGTVSELEAAGIATQGFALKLARTPAEFEKLTRAAREVVQVSPTIKDLGEALTQLSLFAANEASFARADQLGLSAGEVKDRIKELQAADDSLSGSQAKLIASMQLLDEKFGATLNTAEAQASGIERLRVAWEDFKVTVATANLGTSEFFSIDKPAANVATILSIISGNYSEIQSVTDAVGRSIQFLENRKNAYFFPEDTTSQIEDAKQRLGAYQKAYDEVAKAIAAGVPGADKYKMALDEISRSVSASGVFTDAQIAQLQELDRWYQDAALSAVKLSEAEKLRAENKISADQFEQVRQGNILEQQPGVEDALVKKASKVATIDLEKTIQIYREQKAQVEQAIQDLVNTGVSDQGEIAIRVAALTEELIAPFDALKEEVATIDFGNLGAAMSGFDVGFVDFLPSVAGAREELAQLAEEMMYTSSVSEEQAAQFEYLSAMAYAVDDAGSQLNSVVAELGSGFLESNTYAAALVDQMFQAEASFRAGLISADVYAGITTILSGRLLTLAQTAGIATGAIYALNSAQADMASAGGLAVGGSIAERVQTTQAAAARESNRKEQERYNRELDRAAKSAARHQESAARKAGKLLEDGAKKANDELKKSLDSVPGLFSTTQVTEQDMKDAEMGIYKEKADEYLRRLRDEVVNGKQWEDVSIEEARAGLERAGLEVGNTAEQTLALLERAMNDSSLYSAAENIPIFINEEAVKYTQELQKKSDEGRKNIYAYFGVVVDEAVNASTGGGGGGYTPPEVTPPNFIDIDPLTEGLQTGLDEYVNQNGELIRESWANAQNLFFNAAGLFGSASKTGVMGPIQNPEIKVTADPTAQALTPYITGQQQATVQMQVVQPGGAAFGPQPQGQAQSAQGVTLTPAIDATALQTEIDKLTPTVGVQLHVTVEEITLFKQTVAGIVSPSVSVGLKTSTETMTTWATGVEKDAPSPNIETKLNTTVGTLSDWVLWVESNAPKPNVGVLLHTTAEEIELYKQTISGIVKPTVEVALSVPQQKNNADGSKGANAITPLITDINTQIRSSQEQIGNQGITIAQILMAGMIAHFKGGQQGGAGGATAGQAATPIADALMTAVSTQISTVSNMFYATGFLPAQNIESGFKGYTYSGMADNLQAQINQAISSKAGEFITVGGYIGGWISQGLNQSFNAEINLSFASNAGSAWATAFMKGAISTLGGGALLQSISDKVITDLATELEK